MVIPAVGVDDESVAAGGGRESLGGLIMATATALDPATELEKQVQTVSGVRPLISIAGNVALVSYRLPGEVLTQVWLRGDGGWSMRGTDRIGG